jgi:hypothetical protein
MAIVPISKSEFGNKRFKRYDSYRFAAKETLAPLVLKETMRAMMVMPIGFARAQDALTPVAVQGFGNGRNLFVAPDGRWIGRYIPAAYRGYPFVLANGPEDKQVLCFDTSSNLLSDTDGEAFFNEQAEPSAAVNDVLNFLTQTSINRQATLALCKMLDEHQLIEPWPIKIKTADDEQERNVEGLFRVHEKAFLGLDAQSLSKLRDAGAFTLIYCQLLSMQHIQVLGEMEKAYQAAQLQAALPKDKSGELDLSFLADDTTISFENL